MRYITLLTATSTPEGPPPGELMAAIAQLGEQATQAGVFLDTAGLAPSAAGARIELSGGSLSASDGPFTEANERVSYALYQVASKEEAVSCTRTSSTGPATSATCRCSRCSGRRTSVRPPEPGARSAGRSSPLVRQTAIILGAHDHTVQRSHPQRARVT